MYILSKHEQGHEHGYKKSSSDYNMITGIYWYKECNENQKVYMGNGHINLE